MADLLVLEKSLQKQDFQQGLQTANAFQLNVAREVFYAQQIVMRTPKLKECSVESVQAAILDSVISGLTLNPNMNQSYLVPRYNKKTRKLECTYMPGYQGLITKMIESGVALDVYAEIVYEGCRYSLTLGTKKTLEHVPYYMLGTERGAMVGAYAVAVMQDNLTKWDYRPIDQVMDIAQKSEAFAYDQKENVSYSPWSNHLPDMVKKTMVKILWKFMPKRNMEHLAQLMEKDNIAAGYSFDTPPDDIPDVETDTGVKIKTVPYINGKKETAKPEAPAKEATPVPQKENPSANQTLFTSNDIPNIPPKGAGSRTDTELQEIYEFIAGKGLDATSLNENYTGNYKNAISLLRNGSEVEIKEFLSCL
jgi:phage RecT family recombinase